MLPSNPPVTNPQSSDFFALLVSLLPGVGPSRYWSWLEHHGSAEAILQASPQTLPSLSAKGKTALLDYQRLENNSKLYQRGEQIIEVLEQCQAGLISHSHEHYPSLLKTISRPPPVIFTKGFKELLSLPQIAIIGTRNPSASGIDNARSFSQHLSRGGFTITSGLAMGIDGEAHRGALQVQGGTIAVMATGIEQVYPRHHQSIADAIVAEGGLLVTEFPPGIHPQSRNFPRRNRIISGLSLGVLVIEAAVKSGSLITARYALEQNREVFAIPGSIHNPQAKGCHALIKEGAHLVETSEDIIQNLSSLLSSMRQSKPCTTTLSKPQPTLKLSELKPDEQALVKQMSYDTVSIDQLVERSGLSSAEISVTLLNLELKGLVQPSAWGYELVHTST